LAAIAAPAVGENSYGHYAGHMPAGSHKAGNFRSAERPFRVQDARTS
jgi:hypothetical protein